MAAKPGIEWRHLLTTGVLVAGATVLVVGMSVDPTRELGFDFRGAYLPAAHAVISGESPYPALADPTGYYVYPPQLAIALTPLTLVSEHVAVLLAVLASAGLLVAALAVLGVRDLRCYAAVFIWAPTWNELDMASVTSVLVFALALAWRYRDSTTQSALVLGLAVATKLFLWPLLLWSVATRRLRAAALGLAGCLVLIAVSWAAIGFDGLTSYPALLSRLDRVAGGLSYSFVGVASVFGLSTGEGHLVSLFVGVALLAACALLARRGDDLGSFTLSIAAAIALTPIVWMHYLLLLLVPLAVARPRFSVIWTLPIVLWIAPWSTRDPLEKVLPIVVAAVIVALLLRRPERTRAARAMVPA